MATGNITTTAPAETCTLSDFVAAGASDDMTYRNFSILEVVDIGLELVDHCLIDDYLPELRSVSTTVNGITDAERRQYKYAPDLLAYDIYGSTQLDFVIMAINGVATPLDFNLTGPLLLPYASVLTEALSYIYNAEKEYISINRSKNGIT